MNNIVSGDLQTVLGTKRLVNGRKTGFINTITFRFLVVKPNEHQIDDVKRLTKELDVYDKLKH